MLSQAAGILGWSVGGIGRKQQDISYACLGSIFDPSFLSPRVKDVAECGFVTRHSEPGAKAELLQTSP